MGKQRGNGAMRVAFGGLAMMATLAGCVSMEEPVARPQPQPVAVQTPSLPPSASQAARNFVEVVRTVEPVAENECRLRAPRANCDFRIVVDDRPGQPPNAFQTLDETGRPILAFTLPLIAEARNVHELAFVMGHEASHHIEGHIPRQKANATAGAVIFAGLATLTGGDANAIRSAQELGATIGARSYSKDFELEADALGTLITKRAGYDPVLGAEFFTRIPDPGNRFLGTHPPNAQRIEVVRRTAAGI